MENRILKCQYSILYSVTMHKVLEIIYMLFQDEFIWHSYNMLVPQNIALCLQDFEIQKKSIFLYFQ